MMSSGFVNVCSVCEWWCICVPGMDMWKLNQDTGISLSHVCLTVLSRVLLNQKKLVVLAKLALGICLLMAGSVRLQTHTAMISRDLNTGLHIYKASILTQGAISPVPDEIFIQYKNSHWLQCSDIIVGEAT